MYNSFHAVHNLTSSNDAKKQILTTFRNMKLIHRFLNIIVLFTLTSSIAQDTIPYLINHVEYKLFNGMNQHDKTRFLEAINASDVEVASFTDVEFPVRITFQNGKKNLMRFGEVEFMSKKHMDSIAFITRENREIGLTFGNRKGQDQFIFGSRFSQRMNKKLDTWDEIEWRNLDKFKRGIQAMENGESYEDYGIAEYYVRKKGKWGVVGYSESNGLQLFVPPIYTSKDDIELKHWPIVYTPNFRTIRKKHKVDLIEPIPYLDDYYMVRHRKNMKWGVVRVHDIYELIIDTQYDSLTSYKDQYVILAWKDGKVGIYNDRGKLFYPSEFDDAKLIHLDYMYGVALLKKNDWFLYSIEKPELIIKKSAKNTDQLIEYWLK